MDEHRPHLFPWYLAWALNNPLRRALSDPEALLGDHVGSGMTTLDVGCATGFFTLPLARLVGAEGKVVAVDLQERMLRGLGRRVRRAGMEERVELRQALPASLGLEGLVGQVDVALASAVIHEVPEPGRTLGEIAEALSDDGVLLLLEPTHEVSERLWQWELDLASEVGLVSRGPVTTSRMHGAVLGRSQHADPGRSL